MDANELTGWTVGDPETEEAQNRFIASKNGAVVVSFDYRRFEILSCQDSLMLRFCRAPEFQFPYALEDSYDVLRWVRRLYVHDLLILTIPKMTQCIDNAKSLQIDKTRIILGGGSAGANLVCFSAVTISGTCTHGRPVSGRCSGSDFA